MRKLAFVLIILFAFFASSKVSAQELLSRGWIVSSISNNSDAAPVDGLYFSLPQGQSVTITLQTSFAVNPGSITVQLQTSLDAVTWTTVVSSTSVTGESITAYNQVAKYVRARVSARAGGSGVTAQLLANYSYGGSYLNNIVTTPVLAADGNCANPSYSFSADPDNGMTRTTTNSLTWATSGSCTALMSSTNFRVRSDMAIGFSSSTDPTAASFDTVAYRDAANIWAQRNGTAPQTFRLYNTFTDAANYERLTIQATAANVDIFTSLAGTGAQRPLRLGVNNAVQWQINTSGHFLSAADNTYDIGATGATRPRDGHFGRDIYVGGEIFGYSGGAKTRLNLLTDGIALFRNVAATDFTRLSLGGITEAFNAISTTTAVGGKAQGIIINQADGTPAVFADLGAATNGAMIYCSDCTIANPCAGAGTGAIAKRLNSVWVCN